MKNKGNIQIGVGLQPFCGKNWRSPNPLIDLSAESGNLSFQE